MSSTTRTISYRDLERFLTQIGFRAEQARTDYLLFRSARPDVLIVLPARRADDVVDAAHLLAVRKHVLENGILDEASFDLLVWGSEPTVTSQ